MRLRNWRATRYLYVTSNDTGEPTGDITSSDTGEPQSSSSPPATVGATKYLCLNSRDGGSHQVPQCHLF